MLLISFCNVFFIYDSEKTFHSVPIKVTSKDEDEFGIFFEDFVDAVAKYKVYNEARLLKSKNSNHNNPIQEEIESEEEAEHAGME